jgi:hypothetical protein
LFDALPLCGGSLKARLEEPALAWIVRVEDFRTQAVHLALQRVEQQFVTRERLLNRRCAIFPVFLGLRRIDGFLLLWLLGAAGCDGAALVGGVPPRSSLV